VTVHAQPRLQEVEVQALEPARLEALIGVERMAHFEQAAEAAQAALAGRIVWNVNSTAVGGGVAEMLQTLLAYARGAGVDARWLVIEGAPQFFVLLHDPQTAGLAGAVHAAGARSVWRCHVGRDEPNEWTERAWEFLRAYLEESDAYVFSRAAFAPSFADTARTHVIPPSIDPFSAKNEAMSARNVRLALGYVGLIDGDGAPPVVPFTRRDGSPGRINRHVDVVQSGPAAPPNAPLVIQASRWDRMKDMPGVMHGFAEHVDPSLGAHLVLAGPAVTGVADDPEAVEVYDETVHAWRELPHAARGRVHLACVPMKDPDEAAAIVNALQRHAAVAAQKSLAEGFGLTVVEAMWKSKPVVASAVGGIADQIVHEEHGLLVTDPDDLAEFGAAVESLLRDPSQAERLGRNARARAAEQFLGDRHLGQYARLFDLLDRLP
jgi:trehalose synthase